MIDYAESELGLIFLDHNRLPLSQVRCWVCHQAIPEHLVQRVTNGDIGAVEMCGDPKWLGYVRFVQTGQDSLALKLGLMP